jgi:hypothetical protein
MIMIVVMILQINKLTSIMTFPIIRHISPEIIKIITWLVLQDLLYLCWLVNNICIVCKSLKKL